MQTSAPIGPPKEGVDGLGRALSRLLAYLPRGNTLDNRSWLRRHKLLQWVLLIHVPGMLLLGLVLGTPPLVVGSALIAPVAFLVLGHVLHNRRLASSCVTGGLVFCSAGLVVLTSGSIEAHFHFFIIIGFIALYQDWVPFLWNVAFTVLSHGIGTIWFGNLIFAHAAGQANPWLWSAIHGIAVLFACVGMVIFWRVTEEEQAAKEALGRRLITADAEIGRRRFTSDMLVNLARRNQSMLYRQLDIINQLEEAERDPDTLSHLFTLDHLATRVRRNAESLLVLAGEQPPRTWSAPVPLRDVVRAAIAETEDLDRVVFAIDDQMAVAGGTVADLTHLLAELTENAVRFSPPDTAVTIRARPDRRGDGGYLLTIEDWGVGMPPDDIAAANDILAVPREVDLAVAQRLGFHVVGRLAARHGIGVSLGDTPGSGVTAVVSLPAPLFSVGADVQPQAVAGTPAGEPRPEATGPLEAVPPPDTERTQNGSAHGPVTPEDAEGPNGHAPDGRWHGWWSPESARAAARQSGRAPADTPVDADRSDGPADAAAGRKVSGRRPRPTKRQPSPEAAQGSPDTGPAESDVPTPRPSRDAPTGNGTGGRPTLRRRVPQAHLAPELRQPSSSDGPDVAPPPANAASALSRYQASRQAAQAVVDETEAGGMH
jgi:signal transduction histidine kinase